MPRLMVDRILSDPRFATTFIVYRKTGAFVAGRFIETEEPLAFKGVAQPAGTKDIIQVPEGDRTSEIVTFLSREEMFVTHASNGDNAAGTSDEIMWHEIRYRIFQVKNWKDYGYFRAIGISMGGD